MKMHNPPHPGQIIKSIYIDELGLSYRDLAKFLDVSATTIGRVVTGKSNISPEMAVRLSRSFGKSAESWLRLQEQYDLWHIQQNDTLFGNVQRFTAQK